MKWKKKMEWYMLPIYYSKIGNFFITNQNWSSVTEVITLLGIKWLNPSTLNFNFWTLKNLNLNKLYSYKEFTSFKEEQYILLKGSARTEVINSLCF